MSEHGYGWWSGHDLCEPDAHSLTQAIGVVHQELRETPCLLGVLGFSQGAALAATAVARWSGSPIPVVVLVSGFEIPESFPESPSLCASRVLHVWGQQDSVVSPSSSSDLRESFSFLSKQQEEYIHHAGHVIGTTSIQAKILEELNIALNSFKNSLPTGLWCICTGKC